jgi:hypothetical protein
MAPQLPVPAPEELSSRAQVPELPSLYATPRPATRYEPERKRGENMRSGCLWLIGVPIPIILLLWLLTGHA